MIYCLVGKSGSGKTTIAKELFDRGYNVIQSYTTRPKRYDGEWGHIHVPQPNCFTEEGDLKDNVIGYVFYQGHHYWATKEQVHGNTIYVVDPVGVKVLESKGFDIITIELFAPESVLKGRMYDRKYPDGVPKGVVDLEIEQRVVDDRKHFQDFVGDYGISTHNKSIEAVADIIEGLIGGDFHEPVSMVGVA